MIDKNITPEALNEHVRTKYLESGKPIVVAFKYRGLPLDNMAEQHFKKHDYLWQDTPIQSSKDSDDVGLHMGMWLNESLEHVHLVLVAPEVLDYIVNQIYRQPTDEEITQTETI